MTIEIGCAAMYDICARFTRRNSLRLISEKPQTFDVIDNKQQCEEILSFRNVCVFQNLVL